MHQQKFYVAILVDLGVRFGNKVQAPRIRIQLLFKTEMYSTNRAPRKLKSLMFTRQLFSKEALIVVTATHKNINYTEFVYTNIKYGESWLRKRSIPNGGSQQTPQHKVTNLQYKTFRAI